MSEISFKNFLKLDHHIFFLFFSPQGPYLEKPTLHLPKMDVYFINNESKTA